MTVKAATVRKGIRDTVMQVKLQHAKSIAAGTMRGLL